jgi:hypothetical protein
MNDRLPAYAQETEPLVGGLLGALKDQDEHATAPLLMPGSEADWVFRLFGMGPLIFLLYMHLENDEFVLPRFGRRGSREVLVEVGWVTGVDADGKARYDPRSVSTVKMQRYESDWRVHNINPGPLDKPVSVSQAPEVLGQVVEEGRGREPLWYPLGVLTGAFQLKRLGHEPLDDVEQLFIPGMEDSEYGVPEIVRAVRMWREFRERAHPTYRRGEVYAAAVEYIMVLFGFYGDSQASIAERYGVSPASISSKWHEIESALGLSQFDSRYSVHEDPGAGLEAMLRGRGEEPPPPLSLGVGRGVRTYDRRVS